jgi:hypothetical protein
VKEGGEERRVEGRKGTGTGRKDGRTEGRKEGQTDGRKEGMEERIGRSPRQGTVSTVAVQLELQPAGRSRHWRSSDISVQNNQSVGIFQYKIFSQSGYSSTKYSVSRDIPVQNIQTVGIFQYKIFSQ